MCGRVVCANPLPQVTFTCEPLSWGHWLPFTMGRLPERVGGSVRTCPRVHRTLRSTRVCRLHALFSCAISQRRGGLRTCLPNTQEPRGINTDPKGTCFDRVGGLRIGLSNSRAALIYMFKLLRRGSSDLACLTRRASFGYSYASSIAWAEGGI